MKRPPPGFRLPSLPRLNRRDLLKYTTGVGGALLASQLVPDTAHAQTASTWVPSEPIYAYPNTHSFRPGDLLQLHVSMHASAQSFRVDISGLSAPQFPITTNLPGTAADHSTGPGPDSDSPLGDKDWRWPVALSVRIPDNTPPGIYKATVTAKDSDGNSLEHSISSEFLFVVRSNQQKAGPNCRPTRRILYKMNLLTVHAYASTPGSLPLAAVPWRRNFYDAYSNASDATMTLSLRRPVHKETWDDVLRFYDDPMLDWLEKNGYSDQVDYCTDIDIHMDTSGGLLSQYDLLLSVGHDEYWSAQMRKHVESFRDAGGNIAFLSGNTCFWKVTLDTPKTGEPTTMRCNKGDNVQTGDGPDIWWRAKDGAGNPWQENQLLGVSTRNGGIRNPGWEAVHCYPLDYPPDSEEPMPLSPALVLQHTDHWCHWAKVPTGLQHGAAVAGGGQAEFLVDTDPIPRTLLFKELLIGYETDGAEIFVAETHPLTYAATHRDGTPENFAVLGVAVLEPHMSNKALADLPDHEEKKQRKTHWATVPREYDGGIYAGTMGAYSAYGSVFTAATTDWVKVLNYQKVDFKVPENHPVVHRPPVSDDHGSQCMGNLHVHRITRNVLYALSSREKDAVAVGNFTGGTSPDILFQHRRTAEVLYWKMSGSGRTGTGSILCDAYNPPTLDWKVVGTFQWSTRPDILFQNQQTGELSLWRMEGVSRRAVSVIPGGSAQGKDWKLVGIGDLNGDSKPDLLFQNQLDGKLRYWLMDGLTSVSTGDIVEPSWAPAGTEWRVVGLGKLGTTDQEHLDILFQSRVTGALGYWRLQGTLVNPNGGNGGIWSDGTGVQLHAELKAVAFAPMGGSGASGLLLQDLNNGKLFHCTLGSMARSALQALAHNPWLPNVVLTEPRCSM